MRKQTGEIGTTLTVMTVMLMTFGVFIGSALVSKWQANPTATEAQTSGQIAPNTSNPHIESHFSSISNRSGTSQKKMDAFICFKTETGLPPSSGRYVIEAILVLKDNTTVKIGGALDKSISSPLSQFQCPSDMKHTVYTYSSIEDIPGDVTYAQADHIEFHLNTQSGNWDPSPMSLIGTMTDISPIFGAPPATPTPSASPTPSPSPTPVTPPGPVACPQLTGIVPQETIDAAIANPSGIAGWDTLEKPAEAESATNRRKRSLTLKNIDIPFHPLTNGLIFEAVCKPRADRPGKLTLNVKMDNTQFTGVFDGFEYIAETCDFNDKNRNGTYDFGDAENCRSGSNKTGTIKKVKKVDDRPFTSTTNDVLDLPGGKRVVRIAYGFWKDYEKPTARKDNSGVAITFSNICSSAKEDVDSGITACLVTIDGDKTVDAAVKLPDTTNQLFRFSYLNKVITLSGDYKNAEYVNCAIGDGTANTTTNGNPCTGTKTDDTFTLTYANTTQSAVKLTWFVIRCNGDFANPTLCKPATYTNPTIDVKNFFPEAALFEIAPGKKRTCVLNLGDYPVDDETDTKVRQAVTCTISDITPPTATPVPPTATPTEGEDEEDEDVYYAQISLYNSSSKKIVHVKTRSCANGVTCVDDEGDVEIPPRTRALLRFKLGNILPDTEFFTVRVYVRLEGEEEERGLTSPLTVDEPQNVYYDLKISDTKVEGTGETELQASDVSGNQCVNADDATKVIGKLAEFTEPDQCIPEDINCDGVVNTLDLSVIISNFNGGPGCAANQPVIRPSVTP